MRLEKVKIKNFRSYQQEVIVDFDDITTLIGKNDIGKSTILEALEIFFNNSTVKITSKDANVHSADMKVEISCLFSGITSVSIDATNETDLRDEYLLNEEGLLEVKKVYNCALKSPSEEVFIHAFHPNLQMENHLIQLTTTKLKTILQKFGIEISSVDDKRVNADYRKAIFSHFSDVSRSSQDISLAKETKTLWDKLKLQLPIFTLFQADRNSSDGDAEVQDPMKLAIREALAEVENELDDIKEKIVKHTMSVTTATLEKLKEMDATLAESLIPQFLEEPKWNSIFKFTLEDSFGVPINKRGSGVRRLVLLNFFRAASERTFREAKRPIIYAIEEPETAQHPNNQKMLAEAFLTMSQKENVQVVLTTHVPGFASMMPFDSIRYIDILDNEKVIRNSRFDEYVLKDVSEVLGVFPSPIDKAKVKLAIVVEGNNDINALKHFSRIVSEKNPLIKNLNDNESVLFIMSGGSSLKYWVINQYLKSLGIPEFHLIDRDDETKPQYEKYCDMVNNRNDGSRAYLTIKREVENYIHPLRIKEYFGLENSFEIDDFTDVPEIIKSLNGMKHSTSKLYLNNEVIDLMTYEELKEMDKYNEIEGVWLKEISEYIQESNLII